MAFSFDIESEKRKLDARIAELQRQRAALDLPCPRPIRIGGLSVNLETAPSA